MVHLYTPQNFSTVVGVKYEVLSPQSPDLNPLDYSVWINIESKACKVRHSSVEYLKSSVNRSWAPMRKDYIRKVCKGFLPRLSRVITVEGGHIEKYYCNNPKKCMESPICFLIPINGHF